MFKRVDKLLIITAIIVIMLGAAAILISITNVKINIKGSEQLNINYSTTESNTWDVSKAGDGSVIATLSEDGTLTISGIGEMEDYYSSGWVPWKYINEKIKSVIIEEGVTSIGGWTFSSCNNMTNITIPDSVIKIGEGAFSWCSSLTNINIPNGLKVIEKQLFGGCSSLTKIEIPEGVTEIKNYAFLECTSLETIIIPDTVTSISSRVFQYCQKLKNINIPQNAICADEMFFQSVLQIWTTIGEETEQEIALPDIIARAKNQQDNLYTEKDFTLSNCNISDDNTKLIMYTQDLKDGNEIGITVNEGPLKGLTIRIMLPEVTWDIAKDENSNVKAIFKYNEKLLTITGNGEMKDFGWDCGPWYYLRNYIENVVIEYGVTSIGTYCFFDNPGVNNISLPESIKLIAPYAFRGCSNLETINIPEGTQIIGTGAFSVCDNLKEVNISSTVLGIGIDTVTMEWDEGMLEGLVITSTGEVFKECASLKNINVNSNNKNYSSDNGVLYNKNKTSLVIYPAGKENEEFEIPDTVTEICADAFDSCVNLKSIEIPGTVEEIKNQCFRGSNLINVILNEGLKRIGEYAFYENDSIQEIYIPSTVESIGEGALGKMESLKNIEVSLDNKIYTSENGILFSKDKLKIIQYPTNKDGTIYIIPDTVESIETGAFAYGNNLNYLKINDNTSKIDTSAFVFSQLIGIYIPNSVETICVFYFGGTVTTPFDWCEDCTIYCNDDSYAKDFCVQYSLNYSTNTEEIFEKFATKVLEGITVTTPPSNTVYIEGQNFDPTGMVVTASYNDGSTKEVTNYTIIDGENLTSGKTSVTISYTEDEITKTTTQSITVSAKLEIDLGTYEEQQEETGKYITKIAPETTIGEVLENIDTNGTIEIYKGTQKITDTEKNIGTGLTVRITLDNQKAEYTIVVKGDINGDGNAKLSDLSKLKLSIVGTTQLEGAYKEAADINGDGNVKLSDLSKMKLYLVGTGSL
ncbi:MAG: leucine-rich repeat protein [Clostridia bacterium]|nr:leucine-rich repeat protein [Clostridia bacterium]